MTLGLWPQSGGPRLHRNGHQSNQAQRRHLFGLLDGGGPGHAHRHEGRDPPPGDDHQERVFQSVRGHGRYDAARVPAGHVGPIFQEAPAPGLGHRQKHQCQSRLPFRRRIRFHEEFQGTLRNSGKPGRRACRKPTWGSAIPSNPSRWIMPSGCIRLGSSTRMGLTWKFGRSVLERREENVNQLVQKAFGAAQNGNYLVVQEQLQAALDMDPSNKNVQQLRREIPEGRRRGAQRDGPGRIRRHDPQGASCPMPTTI